MTQGGEHDERSIAVHGGCIRATGRACVCHRHRRPDGAGLRECVVTTADYDDRRSRWPKHELRHPNDLCIHMACADCGWRWSHEREKKAHGFDCNRTLCWLCEREREPYKPRQRTAT